MQKVMDLGTFIPKLNISIKSLPSVFKKPQKRETERIGETERTEDTMNISPSKSIGTKFI